MTIPCRQRSFASFSVRLQEEALYWDSNVASLVRHTYCCRSETMSCNIVRFTGDVCTAAFDCVDYDLLLQRLQLGFGFAGAVLEWFAVFFRVVRNRSSTMGRRLWFSSCYSVFHCCTKTEALWLGSSDQLSQISITDIPLQSTMIKVAESARDLGVDSKLSLSAQCGGPLSLWFLPLAPSPPIAQITDTWSSQNTAGVHFKSPGLL